MKEFKGSRRVEQYTSRQLFIYVKAHQTEEKYRYSVHPSNIRVVRVEHVITRRDFKMKFKKIQNSQKKKNFRKMFC